MFKVSFKAFKGVKPVGAPAAVVVEGAERRNGTPVPPAFS